MTFNQFPRKQVAAAAKYTLKSGPERWRASASATRASTCAAWLCGSVTEPFPSLPGPLVGGKRVPSSARQVVRPSMHLGRHGQQGRLPGDGHRQAQDNSEKRAVSECVECFCFGVLLEAGPAGQVCLAVVQERSPQIEWPQGDCILLIFLWSKPLNYTAGFQGHQAATCIAEKRATLLENRNITKNDLHSFQRRFSAFLVTHVHSLSRREWPPSTLGKEKPA